MVIKSERDFFENILKEKKSVTVFLINGIKLVGTLMGVEENSIILTTSAREGVQIIYKGAISTISETVNQNFSNNS